MNIPLGSPKNIALFTDFDGTLVSIAATPQAVKVPEALPSLLQQLNLLTNGALALITGRTLADLTQLLSMDSIAAAGSHGAEWQRADGNIRSIDQVDTLFAPIKPILIQFAKRHNLILEDKAFSIALHFRQTPHLEHVIDELLDNIMQDVSELKVMAGKAVREIKPKAVSKGIAIERFMQEPAFVGRTPYYIGDDVTDEDGFAWVNQVGGVSIKVGGEDTLADFRLADTEAVLKFLTQLTVI